LAKVEKADAFFINQKKIVAICYFKKKRDLFILISPKIRFFMKILLIGAGNMGQTFAQSFLRSHIVTHESLLILAKNQAQADALADRNLGKIYLEPAECLPLADLIILAVKPQDSSALFEKIRPFTDAQQLFLSIMAGVRIEKIADEIGAKKIVRAMPNLPAQIGLGMTVLTSSDDVTRIELAMVQNLLSTTGKTLYVAKESAIDASTAISGSGPAYVFFFMDALMQAAREMDFSDSEAEMLVAQTFTGAVDLFNKNNLSCSEWIQKVASKGGTTEAALAKFGEKAVFKHIIEGTISAWERAAALGK
jgi:pyrroline-5-carboxylate reductase